MIKKIFQEKSLALIIWCSFLVAFVCFYLFHALRLMHPFPVPAVLFIYLLIPATVILFIKGFFKVLIFPERLKTAGWTLLGITPFLIYIFTQQTLTHSFQSGQINYSVYNFEINQSASYQSLKRMYLYPYRFEGEKVVMWTDWKDWDEGAWQQVRKMDESIKKMEMILGKECTSKIHWIRPESPTSTGMNLQGMMFGTVPDRFIEKEDFKLNPEDTGGMAGVVLDHLSGNMDHPVSLLKLGWKSYQNETNPEQLVENLWQDRLYQVNFSIRELIDTNFGYLPYEIYGGPFVEYLINTYGNKKFLELYSTSSPVTFRDEVERICGLSLEELEGNFWEALEKRVASAEHQKKFNSLYQVKLAQGVDPKDWQSLRSQIQDQYQSFLKAFQNSSYEMKEYETDDELESPLDLISTVWIYQNFLRYKIVLENDDSREASIASTDSIFQLKKELLDNKWSLQTSPENPVRGTGKEALYNWKKAVLESSPEVYRFLGDLLHLERLLEIVSDESPVTITRLKKTWKNESPIWELSAEFIMNSELHSLLLHINPNQFSSINFIDLKTPHDETFRTLFHVSSNFSSNDELLPDSVEITIRDTDSGSHSKSVFQFKKLPMEMLDKEFLPETYGVTLPAKQIRSKYTWKYVISFCAMILAFMTGLQFLYFSRKQDRRKITHSPAPDSVKNTKPVWSRKKKIAWGLGLILFPVIGHQLFVLQVRKNTWASNDRRLLDEIIEFQHRYPDLFSNNLAKIDNEILEEVVSFLRGKKYTRINHTARHPFTDYDFYKFPASDEINFIELYRSNLSDYGFRQLEKLTGIEDITMEGENITDTAISHMGQMKKLESLTLFRTQVTDEGLKQFDQFLVLESFTSENNPITEKGIKAISGISSLRRVNLRDFPVTQQSLKDLRKLPQLISLSLRCPELTDEMILELKGHSTLQELSIFRAKITDQSIPVILSIINLNRLRIEETQISEEGYQNLKKQIPDFN